MILAKLKAMKKKTFVSDKITQVVAENAAKAKRMGGVKDIQIEEKQSIKILLKSEF